MESKSTSLPKVQTELIPDCVRESIVNAISKRFMENIRDPDTKKRYDELGRAFMKRWEQNHPA